MLPDGRWVSLGPLGPEHWAGVMALWRRLQAKARQRFLHFEGTTEDALGSPMPPRALGPGLVALATSDHGEFVVGLGRFQRQSQDEARFWVFVDPAWQGVGLGTMLVRQVAQQARQTGVAALVGDVDLDNPAMLGLLANVGLEYRRQPQGAGIRARLAVRETPEYLASLLADRQQAARSTLAPLMDPGSIAVVGASNDPTSIGGLLWSNLASSGYAGQLYPVNPRHAHVQGATAYPDLPSCPGPPDLAVVCVPAPLVPEVVSQAGKAGVKAVCVISAGFAETGAKGRDDQEDLVATAHRSGLRLVGPNCMGLLRGDPQRRFNATFSPIFPPPGRVSFVSQSGALGLAALALLDAPSLGINGFVSVGNAADVTPTDVILYWDQDPGTDVIVAYLESVPDPRAFARVARHVARHKPIVAVKAGRSGAGQRAAASHTAALATSDAAVDALFHQVGAIRADTLEELFDVATILGTQPVPPGRRVAVLTNGGGPGILVADACQAAGLLVPELSVATQEQLARLLPAGAAVSNPVDMVATCTADHYGQSLAILAGAEEIDALIVIFIPPFLTRAEDVSHELVAAADKAGRTKPIVASFMSAQGAPAELSEAGIPSFVYPERAARALGRVATWAERRDLPPGNLVVPSGTDGPRGRSVVDAALADQPTGGWLDSDAALELLGAYGIPTVASRRVASAQEAAQAAKEMKRPVVVKLAAPVHKSELGGVRVGLESPEEAAEAVREIQSALAARGAAHHGGDFLVQEQAEGVEMLVGVTHDPAFGPLVAVGLGGTLVEALADVALRMTPLTDLDADDMVRSLKAYRMLAGFRGSPPADVEGLKDVLYRVSAMVEDLAELDQLDLNPLFVRQAGVAVADVRIKVSSRLGDNNGGAQW